MPKKIITNQYQKAIDHLSEAKRALKLLPNEKYGLMRESRMDTMRGFIDSLVLICYEEASRKSV